MIRHRHPRVSTACAVFAASLILGPALRAADDGSQIESAFRLNYLGYLAQGQKIALYLSGSRGERQWELRDEAGVPVAAPSARGPRR